MVTMVTMSKKLCFSIFCRSQIALAQPTSTCQNDFDNSIDINRSKTIVRLSDFAKNGLIFNVGLQRY